MVGKSNMDNLNQAILQFREYQHANCHYFCHHDSVPISDNSFCLFFFCTLYCTKLRCSIVSLLELWNFLFSIVLYIIFLKLKKIRNSLLRMTRMRPIFIVSQSWTNTFLFPILHWQFYTLFHILIYHNCNPNPW